MFCNTEEVGEYRFIRPEYDLDGTIFYDASGHKYLLNNETKVVTKLTSEPDITILSALQSLQGGTAPHYRRAAVMCGNGTFRRLSKRNDPREFSDIEYYGELMYNMEADADLHYLILNKVKFSSERFNEYPGEMTIRGSFRRIAIVSSEFTDTKITIISDRNPEVYIIGSTLSASSLRIVDGNGNDYPDDRVCISDPDQIDNRIESLLDYIRSDSDDILDESEPPTNESGVSLFASAAACLAVAGLLAATKAQSSVTKIKQEAVLHGRR